MNFYSFTPRAQQRAVGFDTQRPCHVKSLSAPVDHTRPSAIHGLTGLFKGTSGWRRVIIKQTRHLTWSIWASPLEETTPHLGIMKGLAVDFSVALLLLVDLALGLGLVLHSSSARMHPDALLRGMASRRRPVQRQQAGGRLPLYMMQLYRTMLTDDRARTLAATVGQTRAEDNPGLHDSDSVISLVAKSE